MPRSVLVTGGAGYIGSHTAYALLEAGYGVTIIDNLSNGFQELVPIGADFVELDISDQPGVESIMRAKKIDAVVHFAGSIVVPDSVRQPLAYYQNNTEASRTLIAASVESGIKDFVFSSTAAVYGDPENLPITEEAEVNPINPYGRSKLMTEWILKDACRAHNLQVAILRYFNVAGADPVGRSGQLNANATHLVKVAAQVISGIRPYIEVYGTDYPTPDGTCIRDYIHVSDLADAHVLALVALTKTGKSMVLNCGYGRGYSVYEILDTMQKVSGCKMDIRKASRRPGDPPSLIAATRRITELLNWSPRFDNVSEICRTALEWEMRMESRNDSVAVSDE